MTFPVADLVDALAVLDGAALPDAELVAVVPSLLRARARLDAALTELVGVADERGLAGGEGCTSTAAWLRVAAGVEPAAASRLVETARRLRDLPATREAFRAGAIDLAAAAAVCSATRFVSVEAVRDHLEAPLVELAREADASVVRREVRRARYTLAPEVAAAEAETAFQRRFVDLRPGAFGCFNLEGVLDAEAAAALRTVFASYARPAGPDDGRDAGQRRHDALAELARRALASADVPDGGGERPRVTVLVRAADLATGLGSGELSWAGPLGVAAVRRICCDAEIVRAVLAPDGELLDLGRTTRFPSAAQRRALVARDGGCVFPGCTRPVPWCDAHHLSWWRDGGSTELANLALLCRFHHRLVHEGGWVLARADGGGWSATGPAGRRLHRRRRTTA